METASSSTEQSSSAQSNREDATKRLFKSIYEQVITFVFDLHISSVIWQALGTK